VANGRSYKQYCGIARALDLIGERWALLVIRELVFGPKRFTDLHQGLPGIATNVLSQRLRELEREGVVARRRLPPPAASNVYELTEYGQELVPIMLALGRWGARTMGARVPEQALQPEWLAVALRAFYDPQAANGLSASIALDIGGAQFTLTLERGRLEIAPGVNRPADLTIAADPETLVAYLAGAALTVQAEGDRELLERLPAIFAFGSN
jgi:DNA-binding HxlR family transcriptional regulator